MCTGAIFATLAVLAPSRSPAGEQASGIPAWLGAHVGEGEGQIARPVLERARALYRRKVSEGVASNPCYFAMDATGAGSTSSARPTSPSARSRPVTAADAT
jgi:hypothetical protein